MRMLTAITRLEALCEEMGLEEMQAFNAALAAAEDSGASLYLSRIGEMQSAIEEASARATAAAAGLPGYLVGLFSPLLK